MSAFLNRNSLNNNAILNHKYIIGPFLKGTLSIDTVAKGRERGKAFGLCLPMSVTLKPIDESRTECFRTRISVDRSLITAIIALIICPVYKSSFIQLPLKPA